ncbi:MAG: DIP1984 family protein [Clostridia bacterium]|nr:DIP1984 family protein [Clostridia bacterium]
MKLAEALQERADLNRKIEQLRSRLQSNCLVQEGESPVEPPEALLSELDEAIARLERLIAAINKTNCAAQADGETLTALIARKDCLNVKLSAYRDLVYAASQTAHRARGTEIRILPAVDVRALQKQADALAKALRETDNRLQAANWAIDLMED